jgi:pyruvate dehydrogenase E1 component alpha subunit
LSPAVPEISCTRCLDAAGRPLGQLPAFATERGELVALYDAMLRTRAFDRKAVALQRTGRLGTYASSLGQEAVSVGIASAMQREDVLLPSFREHGAQLLRGVSPAALFQYWGGDERGSAAIAAVGDYPHCLPIGTQAPHAAGVALAFKLARAPRACVCVLGDGASSKGDVYEAMNMAGVWNLPVVFVITNNGWAISLPVARQTAASTLAQKAWAAGFAGEQVDGNDVIAVRKCLSDALGTARAGAGPRCIEALTYRMADHTTADDASRYRSEAELVEPRKADPLVRMQRFLRERFGWTEAEQLELEQRCGREIEDAAAAYLAQPEERPEAMFDSLYASLPEVYRAQRALLSRSSDG